MNSTDFLAAVASGNLDRVRERLAADRSLATARDEEGGTALHFATLNGHQEIVRLLLENGADINARDHQFNATPTGWAIEYLREAGGLLGMEIDDLLFAIRENDVRWVRRLVTRLPALASAHDKNGKPLAQHAAESGHPEIASLFATPAPGATDTR